MAHKIIFGIISAITAGFLIQESGAFWQSVKAFSPDFPVWECYLIPAILEISAIAICAKAFHTWTGKLFKGFLLCGIAFLTIGGAIYQNISPVIAQNSELSGNEKARIAAMNESRKAAEDLKKETESLLKNTKKKMTKADLRLQKVELARMSLEQTQKIENETLKITSAKSEIKFASMANFNIMVQCGLRILFQIIAWSFAALAFHTGSKRVTKASEKIEEKVERRELLTETQAQIVSLATPEIKWTELIKSKVGRKLKAAGCEVAINELVNMRFLAWDKPTELKKSWVIIRAKPGQIEGERRVSWTPSLNK